MPKETPIDIKDSLAESQLFSVEPEVIKGNKQFLVIGVDHGVNTFPQAKQTTALFRERFCSDDLDAIVPDTLGPVLNPRNLEEAKKLLSDSNLPVDFRSWAIGESMETGCHLICADPEGLSLDLSNLIGKEVVSAMETIQEGIIKARADAQTGEQDQLFRFLSDDKNSPENAIFLSASLLGLSFLAGSIIKRNSVNGAQLESKNNGLNRRDFLKAAVIVSGAAMVAGALGISVKDAVGNALKNLQNTNQMMGDDQFGMYKTDIQTLGELFSSDASLKPADYSSPAFVRQSALMGKLFKLGVSFRNAYIANAIDQDLDKILPGKNVTGRMANIAIVMGWGHLLVPHDRTISWFINHPSERQDFLNQSISALRSTNPNVPITGERQPVNIRKLIDDLQNAYSLSILKSGEYKTSKFSVPLNQTT